MAATPDLIDLSSIDLDARIAGPIELKASLAQRGTFEMLNGVIHRDPENGIIVGYKEIRKDDWWAPDHIPERALFPGVLMIESAAQLCSFDYKLREPENAHKFLGFGGANSTRFRGTVEPDGIMYFAAKVHRIRRSLFTYHSQGFYNGKRVFESEIMGVILE
jgi:3-hydroxymyristoyl/3-hydroxydecanoyl-(acyl carrier protein) dehydratase